MIVIVVHIGCSVPLVLDSNYTERNVVVAADRKWIFFFLFLCFASLRRRVSFTRLQTSRVAARIYDSSVAEI